jgi:hypothetical protein
LVVVPGWSRQERRIIRVAILSGDLLLALLLVFLKRPVQRLVGRGMSQKPMNRLLTEHIADNRH